MTITISTITFDSHDAKAVASFWSAALGRPLADGASDGFAAIEAGDGAPGLSFVGVPEGKAVKNRVHLDLTADDRTLEVERLLALGASKVADHDENDCQWTTLRDVEGNEFCVV